MEEQEKNISSKKWKSVRISYIVREEGGKKAVVEGGVTLSLKDTIRLAGKCQMGCPERTWRWWWLFGHRQDPKIVSKEETSIKQRAHIYTDALGKRCWGGRKTHPLFLSLLFYLFHFFFCLSLFWHNTHPSTWKSSLLECSKTTIHTFLLTTRRKKLLSLTRKTWYTKWIIQMILKLLVAGLSLSRFWTWSVKRGRNYPGKYSYFCLCQ